MKLRLPLHLLLSVLALSLTTPLLTACEGGKVIPMEEKKADSQLSRRPLSERESVFGEGGLFGGRSEKSLGGAQGSGGIGVNTYLWRASLDTISFMPVTSADPFGGVIITDWYSPPETPRERFKLNVIIRDKALRADGVMISVFRQVLDSTNQWRDAAVDPDTGRKLEDTVLTRARQIRNEARAMAQ